MKDRPGSQRSLKALFSSLPGPFAVALKVITLQNSLAVIARQQACNHNTTISKSVSFLNDAATLKVGDVMHTLHSIRHMQDRLPNAAQLKAAHVSSSSRVCCLHNGHQSSGHRHRHRQG